MHFSVLIVGILQAICIPTVPATGHRIDRKAVVRRFNPRRNASSTTTPLQVGNGNFAFGVDVTGLQTFSPFATMSAWGWHNFSLPTTPGQTSVEDFVGLDWWTHGRLVNYNQPNPAQSDISSWLIQNPQRLNLARIGFSFRGDETAEGDLQEKTQELDLWTGKISSSFKFKGTAVRVETWADASSDSIGISVESDLLATGLLGIFFDFPFPTQNKFDAPFVGVFNATNSHKTTLLRLQETSATIRHDLDETSYNVSFSWDAAANITGPVDGTHRYLLQPSGGEKHIALSVAFSPGPTTSKIPSVPQIKDASSQWWESFWNSGAFVDLSASSSEKAAELQRRIILSQYLTAVNSASAYPPQESGLVNNGWYGKFHLEMILWHLLHFARWDKYPLLRRSVPRIYDAYLPSSLDRAGAQGYAGARWGKMTDPTGRSAPGEINSLLIWQQPHALYFAETEYRSVSVSVSGSDSGPAARARVLAEWDGIVAATADFMASYAFRNGTTGFYDLGPPMYPASENTGPNATRNAAFELAYWRFGLDVAVRWRERQPGGLPVPAAWVDVRDHLAPLPTAAVGDGDAFALYEGIPDMWAPGSDTVTDHPAMAAIFGLLPPPRAGPPLNLTVVRNTAARIRDLWAWGGCWGWDFPMVAMNSLRLGDVDQAIAYLLDPLFRFDDAGYPEGGSRVPTPYFPGSGSFLLAIAMMAGGWDEEPGSHFPADWKARVEGFIPGL
ncbi:putative six-hairpin glycosidase-like protein [Rosellinia necatrix]|uniref:Putative six-hairpin glycosidase-like protein n=1 Tax=Rosellinia necatrix TaxID=77044 RepID=A0A1W2TL21_ROSNE|nr:putative six-hairpin glycosidase-like protein [Rosellinia necatrix]